jgi:hypothetical protein
VILVDDLLRAGLEVNRFAEEKEGESQILSCRASDQLKPPPVEIVSIDS